ncbi:neurofascin-like [Saccostrea echinata]|uniref:neurofascin-like n=1 Tax=Saccostrea echinata TaxID=191078 RepID=UPI002A80F1F3|nr:neurofascin-like [Saccostrea echinata]
MWKTKWERLTVGQLDSQNYRQTDEEETYSFCNGRPSGVRVSQVEPKKIKISWDISDVSCGILQYAVHYEIQKPLTVFLGVNVTDIRQNSVVVSVTPSFTYNVYVNGLTASAEPPTPGSVLYTVPSIPPDDFPRMHVSSKTLTSLTVEWRKLSIYHRCGNVTGYDILYQRPDQSVVQNSVTGEDTTQYTINGLSPGTSYNIVIRAKNEAGEGKWSQPFLTDSTIALTTKGSTPTTSTSTSTTTSTTTTTTPTPHPTTSTTTASTTPTTTTTATTTTTTSKPTTPPTTTTTQSTITKKSTTTVKTPPTTPSNHTTKTQAPSEMSVPFLLAVVGGCILLLAILIPVAFFICRHCCKAPVGVTEDKLEKKAPKRQPVSHPREYPPMVSLDVAHLVSVVNINPKPPPMKKVPKPNVQYSEFSYDSGYRGLQPHHNGQDYPNLLRKVHRKTPVEKPDKGDFSPIEGPAAGDVHYSNVKSKHVSHTNNVYIHNFMKTGRLFTPSTPITPSIIYRKPREYYDTLPVTMDEESVENIPLSQYNLPQKPSRFKARASLNEQPPPNYTP